MIPGDAFDNFILIMDCFRNKRISIFKLPSNLKTNEFHGCFVNHDYVKWETTKDYFDMTKYLNEKEKKMFKTFHISKTVIKNKNKLIYFKFTI